MTSEGRENAFGEILDQVCLTASRWNKSNIKFDLAENSSNDNSTSKFVIQTILVVVEVMVVAEVMKVRTSGFTMKEDKRLKLKESTKIG